MHASFAPSFLLAVCSLSVDAASADATAVPDWLSGTWAQRNGDRWSEETWLPARAGSMFAVNRSGQGNQLKSFEFLRIEISAEGKLVYHAAPAGRPAVAFELVESGDQVLVFQNLSHDFPQRIRYQRHGEQLKATIADAKDQNAMSWTWTLVSK